MERTAENQDGQGYQFLGQADFLAGNLSIGEHGMRAIKNAYRD